ncbi:MAG: DMT family transporter [Blastocatellia bacterium]|jgi:transporter family-2 protein
MKIGWLAFTLIAGMLIPAQAAINSKMRTYVVSPFYSAMINFMIGLTALIVITLLLGVLRLQAGEWRAAVQAPWWAWCGGLIGVIMVISGVLVVPKMGAAFFTVGIMVGQLAGALVLDHYGLFGLPHRLVTPSRVFGVLLLLLGIWFVQRR